MIRPGVMEVTGDLRAPSREQAKCKPSDALVARSWRLCLERLTNPLRPRL